MNETHVRILQTALLALPAAALGFARGIDVSATYGTAAGALTCACIVTAIVVWGSLMGDLYGTIAERRSVRTPIPRVQKRIAPDLL